MQRNTSSRRWVRQLDGTFVCFFFFFFPCRDNICIDANLPGYAMTINAAAEISAAATVIQFWNSSVNAAVWITVFLVFIVVINFVGVRLYGEVHSLWVPS